MGAMGARGGGQTAGRPQVAGGQQRGAHACAQRTLVAVLLGQQLGDEAGVKLWELSGQRAQHEV